MKEQEQERTRTREQEQEQLREETKNQAADDTKYPGTIAHQYML